MTKVTELQRNSCLLHGAIQTVRAIENAIPIVHSTSGCGFQQYLSGCTLSGNSGSGYTGGLSLVSSNVIEKQVVFGGTSRLREQIKNTVKVQRGDLYVVLTGCTTELVGDDAPAMTKEAQEQGYPVIIASTPGFKGGTHLGYSVTLKSIIHQLDKFTEVDESKTPALVNILGIVPEQDVFWKGNLEEIRRILELAGVKVNTLFGLGEGIERWASVPKAELNIVLSSWGLASAELLQEKYGTEYLYFDNIPVGPKDTSEFVKKVGESLKISDDIINEVIAKEEKRVAYYIENSLDSFFKYNYKRRFAIVGDSSLSLGILSFLNNPLGLIPDKIIITDDVDLKTQEIIKNKFNNSDAEVIFTEDGKEIEKIILNSNVELILGSSLEKNVAKELDVAIVETSFPIAEELVLNKGYAGYNGAVSLLQDLGSAIISKENGK